MNVQQVMTRDVKVGRPDQSIEEIARVMAGEDLGSLRSELAALSSERAATENAAQELKLLLSSMSDDRATLALRALVRAEDEGVGRSGGDADEGGGRDDGRGDATEHA